MSKIMFEKSTIDKYRYTQISLFALKNYTSPLFLSVLCAFCGSLLLDQTKATAQITPTPNDANTVVNSSDNTFNIQGGTQTGSNLFHSFEKFGLTQNQTANFISNPSIQNILGRVTGGEASVINGLIQVTGGNSNLFLMNPAGMIFGPNASLNVPAAFTATTANGIGFNNQWFNAVGTNSYSNFTGNTDAFAFTQTGGGAIINHGNLRVSSGQSLTLLGGTVINTGTVEAPTGKVNITAVSGEKLVRITPEGSLLSLGLPVETKTAINPLPFTPQSLPELLTGGNVNVATGVTVENGVVKLTGSEVTIPNTPGTTVVTNQINVSGETGGNVNILGDIVGLVDANINASGTNSGGTVLIGGDYQGKGTIPNASRTFISSDSTINADAIENGNGGRVIAWADGTTRFYGNISARGGNSSGDGGFVEVSGKENLTFDGFVNLGATNGKVGQLLLDPASVTISFVGADDNELNDRQILFANNPGGSFSISNTKIIDSLNNGDVTIEATNDITINSSFEAFQQPNSLTLNSPQINIVGSQNISVRGDLNLIGNNLTFDDDQLTSSQGNLNITAQTLTTQNSKLFAQEDLNLKTQGNLNLQGTELSSLGNILLQANNAVNLSETVNPSITRSRGKISIQGNGGIDIQALNLPESLLRSGGDFQLISDGNIIGNARIASGGNFSVAGTGAYSQPSPILNFNGIISSNGNVSFGDYTGSSLKVEAGGSIKGGNINITKAGTFPTGSDPDLAILNTGPAVILQAGVTNLKYSPDNPAGRTFEGTAFTFPNGELPTTATLPGSIEVGDITTAETPVALPTRDDGFSTGSNLFTSNSVVLSAVGEIKTGNITTKKGSVNLTTTNGNIFVDSINTLGLNPITGEGQSTTDSGGSINIDAGGIFRVQKTFPFGFAPDSSNKFPTSILTSRFSGSAEPGTNATINIKHRGVGFIAGYATSNIADDVSGTAGEIFISDGSNQTLAGSYNDPSLELSNSIGVSQVPRPGQPEQPNPDIPDDTQRQLTRQASQNDVCQPTNTSLTLGQRLKKARGISLNVSTSNTANTCEESTQDNNLLRIIPDNRTQSVLINLNPLPQSEINHNL